MHAVRASKAMGWAKRCSSQTSNRGMSPWTALHCSTPLLRSLKRFVALPEHAAEATALWILHAHAIGFAMVCAILALLSPVMRCGKSTLLRLMLGLLPRALPAGNVTPAALFRSIEKWQPTLLIDEADSFLKDDEALRGILNSGHTKDLAYVLRTEGDAHEPRRFSTWCPKTIALIGALPGTLMDRSIAVPMRRIAVNERVERFRADQRETLAELETLARQCARWVQDRGEEALYACDPSIPKELHDRAADNWRGLLAIADAVGGDWPKKARKAAVALTPGEEAGLGIELLADLRERFTAESRIEEFESKELVEYLVSLLDRPWSEVGRNGKPLNSKGLAARLKPFGVRPQKWKEAGQSKRGYLVSDFGEPFARYLPATDPPLPPPRRNHSGNRDSHPPPASPRGADRNAENSNKNGSVAGGADRNAEVEREGVERPDGPTEFTLTSDDDWGEV